MSEEKIGLAELKNLAMGFDRAQMRDVHVVEDKGRFFAVIIFR
jgi:hypothetical protein